MNENASADRSGDAAGRSGTLHEQEAWKRVQAVLRAFWTADPLDDLVAHMKAVEMGERILPILREALLGIDWSSAKRHGLVGSLTALMLVAQDVDEEAARALAHEIMASRNCHAVFVQRLKSILGIRLADYVPFESHGIRLLIGKELNEPSHAAALLKRWLGTVPKANLESISRIYVLESQERTYWGEYLRILSKIALVWRGWNSSGSWDRLCTELTLYHEIGHHVHRLERHDREESEALADAYARERFASAHPVLGRGLTGIFLSTLALGPVREPEDEAG